MPTLNYSVALTGIGSPSISRNIPRAGDGSGGNEVAVAVAQQGTLTTRTNDTTGTITMDSGGHTISTSDNVDVYWSGGVAYDVTVGTVSGTSVPISGASGDALPAQDSVVYVAVRVPITVNIDGDNLQLLGLQMHHGNDNASGAAHAEFQDSDGTTIAELDLSAFEPRIYDIAGGDANPFTGNPILSCIVTTAELTYAGTFKLLWTQDSTP